MKRFLTIAVALALVLGLSQCRKQQNAPTIPGDFTVCASPLKKVNFAKGNLYWGGGAFHFEDNQWDFAVNGDSWNPDHVSYFYWSKTAEVAYAGNYNDPSAAGNDVFFAATLDVEGETWSTLSKDEWTYLLSNRANAESLRKFVTFTVSGNGTVAGLVILPDGDAPSTAIPDTIDEAYLTSNNAVFLPAAGRRNDTSVSYVGLGGGYWSSSYDSISKAWDMNFGPGGVYPQDSDPRSYGQSVRLVR